MRREELNWLTDWLTEWLTDWLTDWLTGWLTDGLTDWMEVLLVKCRGNYFCNTGANWRRRLLGMGWLLIFDMNIWTCETKVRSFVCRNCENNFPDTLIEDQFFSDAGMIWVVWTKDEQWMNSEALWFKQNMGFLENGCLGYSRGRLGAGEVREAGEERAGSESPKVAGTENSKNSQHFVIFCNRNSTKRREPLRMGRGMGRVPGVKGAVSWRFSPPVPPSHHNPT